MTKIVSIGNMKGGVGKTTTAVQFAQLLGKQGRTLLVDADEDLTCALKWTQGDYAWSFEKTSFSDMNPDQLAQYDYVVVDTKGNERGLVELAQNSSLLIIPTKPDGVSVSGLVETLQPLREADIKNYRVLIVANLGGRGEGLSEALANASVPILTTIVRHSTAVGDAAEFHVPLDGLKGNKYSKLVMMDYGRVIREVLEYV